MDGIKKFLPSGPDFAALSAFGNPVAFVIGIVLAIAGVVAIVAFAVNLLKTAASLFGRNPNALSNNGKATLVSLAFVLGIAVFWNLLITFVVDVGNKVA